MQLSNQPITQQFLQCI